MVLYFLIFSFMDFSLLKEKAKLLWNKVKDVTNKAIDFGAETLQNSPFVIKDMNWLDELVTLSANKVGPTGVVYEKKSLLIIWDPSTDFFKKALYILPVVYTKAWSQNVAVKLLSSKIEGIDYVKYTLSLSQVPLCVVFADKKVYKIIAWEENINKLVTSLSLDILSTIEKL